MNQLIIIVAFLLFAGCNSSGTDIDKESIRKISHTAIDTNATLLKKQIDTGLNAWDSIPYDQKRQVLENATAFVGEGMNNVSTIINNRK